MIDITLTKLKYRNPNRRLMRRSFDPPEGTWTFNGGRFKATSSNQGKGGQKVLSIRSRRKAYGPFWRQAQ